MSTLALRGLWLTCGLLLSLITGVAGGVLTHLGGAHPTQAIMVGAATFAATITLILLIINFLIVPASGTPDQYQRRR